MTRGYGQYCPLSLAAELLCQRWTLLVLSRILDGCTHFNEIHRGLPRISPSLLSKRLSELEEAGIVRKEKAPSGGGPIYEATPAGQDLEPVIESLAVWGQQWARDMQNEDLDPAFLVWSLHMRIDTEAMPAGRTVLEFEFSGAPPDCRKFWLVNHEGTVEMCLKDPGLDVDLVVSSDLRLFIEAWRGFRDLRGEIRARRIRLLGPTELTRQFPSWLLLSSLAPFERKRPGRERRLARRSRPGAARQPASSDSGEAPSGTQGARTRAAGG